MIIELLQNIAVLVALAVGLQMLARQLTRRPATYRLASGGLYGAAGVIGMMTPLVFAPGIIYDGRSIVLALAGLFGGPVTAAVAALICGAYRLLLGGPGAVVGVLVIVEASLLGVLLFYLRRRDERWVGAVSLWLSGIVIHLGMLALQLLLPEGRGLDVVRQVGPIVMVFYPLGFLLVAKAFLQAERTSLMEGALRESRAQQQAMIECSPLALYSIDPGGRVLSWNESAERLFGWTEEEVLGRPLPIVPQDKQEEFAALRDRVMAGNTFTGVELVRRRKDGSDVQCSLATSRIEDDEGNLLGIFSAMEDITARKDLEQNFFQAQKMEAVGRLAGGVAHDFNNMLQTILGYTEILLEEMGPGHPHQEYIVQVRKAAERSADLTRQLLGFARKQIIRPRRLDLNVAVADLLKMLQRMIGEDIDLLWQPCPGECPVILDPSQVDQILANLVVNARDAIDGVGRVTIETRHVSFDEDYCSDHPGFQPGNFEMLAVSDDGAGMDRDTLERAFEPFFTTKEKDEGTGLGLATVYGIVRQNQGFINIYSEPGQGTTVRIYLRCATAEDAGPETEQIISQVPTGTETILLVEDEPDLLELSRQLLERLGYNVVTAGNPQAALALVRDHNLRMDLLMTDVIMPQMSGRDLHNQLAELQPGLRCLFMSGYTNNVIAHHGVLEDGVHFLQKPFSRGELAEKVREALS